MSVVTLKHIHRFRDRHGRCIIIPHRERTAPPVARKAGIARIHAGVSGGVSWRRAAEWPAHARRGSTFDRLVQDYYESADYKRLAKDTQRAYQRIIDTAGREANIAHRLVAQMTVRTSSSSWVVGCDTRGSQPLAEETQNSSALRDRQRAEKRRPNHPNPYVCWWCVSCLA